MPIKKREIVATVRWTHKIVTPQYVCHFQSVRERIEKIEPQLHKFIGLRFDRVRELSSQHGWELIDLHPKKKV